MRRLVEYIGPFVPPPIHVVLLPGFEAVFTARERREGGTMLVADVPASVDDRALRIKVSGLVGHYRMAEVSELYGEDPVIELGPPLAAVAPPAAQSEQVPARWFDIAPDPIRVAALAGWAYADLTGLGRDNQWGEEGGRSATSGLTVAEMGLCVPPPGWDGLRDQRYPWEIDGWTPPPGFKAPATPATPPVDEDQNEDPEAPTDVTDDVDPPSEDPPAAVSAPPADVDPVRAVVANPKALEGLTPEQVDLARETLRELDTASGEIAPTARARYRLKAVIPDFKFTDAAIAALRA